MNQQQRRRLQKGTTTTMSSQMFNLTFVKTGSVHVSCIFCKSIVFRCDFPANEFTWETTTKVMCARNGSYLDENKMKITQWECTVETCTNTLQMNRKKKENNNNKYILVVSGVSVALWNAYKKDDENERQRSAERTGQERRGQFHVE